MEMLRRLDRVRFHQTLIYLKNPNVYEEEVQATGWDCVRVRADGSYRWSEVRRLSGELRRRRIDLVHGWALPGIHLGRLAGGLAGTPGLVAHYHNTYGYSTTPEMRRMERLLAPTTDRIVPCSLAVERLVRDQLPTGSTRVETIVNGINLTPLFAAGEAREAARVRHAIPKDVLHIVHTARLVPSKRPEQLLRALSHAVSQPDRSFGDFRATFLGDGKLKVSLPKIAGELDEAAIAKGGERISGRLAFPGYTKEIPTWLASADLHCLVSQYEGLPLSVIEAMAAGTPTLASDVAELRDVMTNEREGLLVDTGDYAAIAAALHRFSGDLPLRRRLAAAGQERAQQFEIAPYIASFERLYETVMAERSSNPRGRSSLGALLLYARLRAGQFKTRSPISRESEGGG